MTDKIEQIEQTEQIDLNEISNHLKYYSLPEVKCANAATSLINSLFDLLNVTTNKEIYCKFEQLSKPDSNNVYPIDREVNVSVINKDLITFNFYIKCVDKNISDYYLIHDSIKYFIVRGLEITMNQIGAALDKAQVSMPSSKSKSNADSTVESTVESTAESNSTPNLEFDSDKKIVV